MITKHNLYRLKHSSPYSFPFGGKVGMGVQKPMKTLTFLLFTLPLFAQVQLTNTGERDITGQVVHISEIELPNATFKLLDKQKNEIPYQKVDDGILALVDLKAGETKMVSAVAGKPKQVAPRTFARYVPERLDDFAWENDKIAFRAYGEALEGTKGDAYGFDVWVKRTSDLVINRRYTHGDYHNDLGDGLDYYKVGLTLGAGNNAPIGEDGIVYSKNYHRYKVLENGPLRTVFVLEFDPWMVDGIEVRADKKFTIEAGSQFYKLETTYYYNGENELPIAVGIVDRPGKGSTLLDEQNGIMAYWEPKHGKDGTTGVAVISSDLSEMNFRERQWIAQTKVTSGKPLVYYVGAAWDKAGGITNAQQWFDYCKQQKESVANSVIKVTKK